MHFTSALVASALALQASAFLVPLEISKAVEQTKSEISSLFNPTSHKIELECPGCPFFGIEQSETIEDDVENKLLLEISLNENHELSINNQPIISTGSITPNVLTAPQIRQSDNQQTRPIRLDYSFERLPIKTSPFDTNKSIHPIRFTILGLEGHPVKTDTLAIDILHVPDTTAIVRVINIPFLNTPGATTCDSNGSKWSTCRIRAIITTRIKSMIEAAKSHAQKGKSWIKGHAHGHGHEHGHHTQQHNPNRPCRGSHSPFKNLGGKFGVGAIPHAHGHGPHGHNSHHSHHHGAHRLGHMIHQTIRFFVVPALLGVIGGLMASAVGMMVGQAIAFLWVRYYRGGRRGRATGTRRHGEVILVVGDDEDEGSEKDALMGMDMDMEVEEPPEYKDIEAEAEAEMVPERN